MKLIIDIVLITIIALCTWGGYKKGLIGSIAALLVIVFSLFCAKTLSAAYSGEVIPALRPFASGYLSATETRNKVLDRLGYGESDKSLDDILTEDPSLRYDYAYECMSEVGLYSDRADEMAARAVELSETTGESMTDASVDVLCDVITYQGGLVLAFLIILIFITALANLFNLSFRLPNLENLDEIGGAVLGFAKGIVYCVLLCWILSYLGLVIGKKTLDGTTLARFFLTFRFITASLM